MGKLKNTPEAMTFGETHLLVLILHKTNFGGPMAHSAQATSDAYKSFIERFRKINTSAPAFTSDDMPEIAEFVLQHAASGTAEKWLKELCEINAPIASKSGIMWGSIALAGGGLLVAAFLAVGIFFGDLLVLLADPSVARGLVTFLFAFATISVFVIASIAIFWSNIEEVEKRAGLAKELIAIMIGVLGTVLGFYFGSAEAPAQSAPTEEVATE